MTKLTKNKTTILSTALSIALLVACTGNKEANKEATETESPTPELSTAIIGNWSVSALCMAECKPLDSMELGSKINISFYKDGNYTQTLISPASGDNEVKGTYKLEEARMITTANGVNDTLTVAVNAEGIELQTKMMKMKLIKAQ